LSTPHVNVSFSRDISRLRAESAQKRDSMLRVLILLLTLGAISCSDTVIIFPSDTDTDVSSALFPGQKPPSGGGSVASTKIEYRVTGNAATVRVRYSNGLDGTAQVITALPYDVPIFVSESTSLFISLDVTPISYATGTTFPFLSIQIFVNGQLFREAASSDFTLTTLSVNGTWRR
jgi:hypothetical protein